MLKSISTWELPWSIGSDFSYRPRLLEKYSNSIWNGKLKFSLRNNWTLVVTLVLFVALRVVFLQNVWYPRRQLRPLVLSVKFYRTFETRSCLFSDLRFSRQWLIGVRQCCLVSTFEKQLKLSMISRCSTFCFISRRTWIRFVVFQIWYNITIERVRSVTGLFDSIMLTFYFHLLTWKHTQRTYKYSLPF